jgi:hypothetical protein
MIYALEVVIALEIMEFFEKPYPEGRLLTLRMILSILLIGLGFVIKTSFAFFGLASILAIGVSLVRARRVRASLLAVVVAAALAGLLVIPWMARGFIMSGYPLFPSNIISIPVIWRLPENDAATIAPIVTDWARTCSNTITLESENLWSLPWLKCEPPEFWEILGISALTLTAAILLDLWRRRKKAPKPENAGALALLAISLATLLFWLWVLPSYRFAGAVFWLLLLSCLLLLLNETFAFFNPVTHLKILIAFSLVFIAWLSPNMHNFDLKKNTLFFPPPAIENAKSHFPQGEIISHPLRNGGIVYSSTGSGSGCWDAPLPCTQPNDVRPDLTMFDKNHLESGFYIAPTPKP